jgi:hypothetical protein
MESVNIEQIMDDIRREIREKPAYQEPITFEDVPMLSQWSNGKFSQDVFEKDIEEMNSRYTIEYYRPLEDHGIKRFFKRLFRKLICFAVRPCFYDATQFNASATACMNSVYSYIRQLDEENRIKEAKIDAQEKRIAALEKALQERGI